jgi:hypothetical protein
VFFVNVRYSVGMTKRHRTILFFALVALFFATAPTVVLYSQGYRVDLEQKKITQVGAFFFEVIPTGAEIYINGKLSKKTDGIFGTALTKNFLPGTYSVLIKKQGYHPWRKTLEIRPKGVTEAKHIILFPDVIEFRESTASMPLLLPPKGVLTRGGELWVQRNGEEIFITRFSKEIKNISWIGEHYLVFSMGSQIKITEIDKRDSLNIITIPSPLAGTDPTRMFYDTSSKTLLVQIEDQNFESNKLIR